MNGREARESGLRLKAQEAQIAIIRGRLAEQLKATRNAPAAAASFYLAPPIDGDPRLTPHRDRQALNGN